jgi:hypothetical protein
MTLNEFTTEIAQRFGKELDMQYRQGLVPQINQWRSRLIRNSLEKHPNEKSQFLQKIYIPLIYGDYSCGSFQCQGSYSQPLPKLLRIGDTPFEYLGAGDGSSPYRSTDIGTEPWINQGMTAHLFNNYRIDNNVLIIPGKRIGAVTGAGIFDEPERAMEWQCKNTQTGCDWWNTEYPITGDIAAMVKTSLWQELGEPKETLPKHEDQDE